MVVELEVVGQAVIELWDALVVPQVDVLVLHRAPEALDEGIVQSPTPAVHADEDLVCLEPLGELAAGELGTLVGVEDAGLVLSERAVQGLQAKARVEGVGQRPGEHIAAVPVDDGDQIQEPEGHRHIGDVGGPHEVRVAKLHVADEVGVDRVRGVRAAGVRPGDGPLQAHAAHQALHAFAVHGVTLAAQPGGHLATAEERGLEVLGVDAAHQCQVLRRLPGRGEVAA